MDGGQHEGRGEEERKGRIMQFRIVACVLLAVCVLSVWPWAIYSCSPLQFYHLWKSHNNTYDLVGLWEWTWVMWRVALGVYNIDTI